jgi:hypothetical protein
VNSCSPRADIQIKQVYEATRSVGIGLEIMKVAGDNELGEAFAAMSQTISPILAPAIAAFANFHIMQLILRRKSSAFFF